MVHSRRVNKYIAKPNEVRMMGKCHYCGVITYVRYSNKRNKRGIILRELVTNLDNDYTKDHVAPKCTLKKGTHGKIVRCCLKCNYEKKDMSYEDFFNLKYGERK